jgi:hypothetical protein
MARKSELNYKNIILSLKVKIPILIKYTILIIKIECIHVVYFHNFPKFKIIIT